MIIHEQVLHPSLIRDYHAHLYYNKDNIEEARQLADTIHNEYGVKIGTFHQKPVGPHPVWSCQLSISIDTFAQTIPWLLLNHGTIDVFVHANTGDDLIDHTQYIMWIGKAYDLKLSIFKPKL